MLDDVPFTPGGIAEFTSYERATGFVAVRKKPLSEFQKSHGCREVIEADTMRALIYLAMAERIKADMTATVEKEFIAEHGRPPTCRSEQ